MTAQEIQQEIEDLAALTESPGWARVIAQAEKAYGPATTNAALVRGRGEGLSMAQLGERLATVHAGHEAVGVALGWPQARLAHLRSVLERSQPADYRGGVR